MKMNEHQIQDLESLISAIRLANEKFKGQVWWRGQRDYSWPLLPSVFNRYLALFRDTSHIS
jgi:hypothetical protein